MFKKGSVNSLSDKFNLTEGYYVITDCNNNKFINYFTICDEFIINKTNKLSKLDLSKEIHIEKFIDYEIINILYMDNNDINFELNDEFKLFILSYNEKEDLLRLSDYTDNSKYFQINNKNIRNADHNKNMEYYKRILVNKKFITVNVDCIYIKGKYGKIDYYNPYPHNMKHFLCRIKEVGENECRVSREAFGLIRNKYGLDNVELNGNIMVKIKYLEDVEKRISDKEYIKNTYSTNFRNLIARQLNDYEYNNLDEVEKDVFIIIPENYHKIIYVNSFSTDKKRFDCSEKFINEHSGKLYIFVTNDGQIKYKSDFHDDLETFFRKNNKTKNYFNLENVDMYRNICDITSANINEEFLDFFEFIEFKKVYFIMDRIMEEYDNKLSGYRFDNLELLRKSLISIIINSNDKYKYIVQKYFPDVKLIQPTITIFNDNDSKCTKYLKKRYNIDVDNNNINSVYINEICK